jgi:hypothetical protein
MRAGVWILAIGTLATSASSSLRAQPSTTDKQLSLTIYNDDLALVEHVRRLDVAAGIRRIEFEGVSAEIMSQTVSFEGPGLEILEQNFDYDLLTPEKLMEKAVGQSVVLVRINPATGEEVRETAEVLSTFGGVVLKIGERIEVLRDDGLPARVIFEEVPPNLRARPTLSILLEAERDTSADVTLGYLTNGLSWDADYVAQFDEAAGEVAIQGWVTLRNTSGTSFENARAQLVAGDVNVASSADDWWQQYTSRFIASTRRRVSTVEPPSGEQLADYYVYPINETTTIANNQTKQVSFLDVDGVSASKGYEQTFYLLDTFPPTSADVRVRFSNSSASGLGEPLPGGVVRVYARDARGQPQFVGEDLIGHTSAGSELSLKIGDAFDVIIETNLQARQSAPRRRTDSEMSYLVTNARAEPVVVTIRQDSLWRFNEVRDESIPGRRTDADSFAWDVPVPANGQTELRVTIRQGPL